MIYRTKMNFAGHISCAYRSKGQQLLPWVPDGWERKSGQPKKTWRSTFQEDLKEKRVSWSGVRRSTSVIGVRVEESVTA